MTVPHVSADVLRTLHRIHRQLSDLRERLDRGPKQVRAAEAHAKHREDQLAALRTKAKGLRMAADAKQLQLKTSEAKIEELKVKLNTASSNAEYQAFREQIAAKKMANSVLDDEILEAWEKSEQLQREVAEAEALLRKVQQQVEQVRAETDRRTPVLEGDIGRLEAELGQLEDGLPPEIRNAYQRIVRQRGEEALAPIEGQFCGGCNTHIPLNDCNKVMLGEPMFCRTCGRLLYVPEEGTPGR